MVLQGKFLMKHHCLSMPCLYKIHVGLMGSHSIHWLAIKVRQGTGGSQSGLISETLLLWRDLISEIP